MRGYEWVLDTWVLATAVSDGHAGQWNAFCLLVVIEEKHRIALDQKGEIEKEYRKYLGNNPLLAKWWKQMTTRTDKISFKAGHISKRKRAQLVNKLRFHPKDVKFVDVAFQTEHKLLVAEESDYTDEIKEFLMQDLGVACLPTAEALAKAQAAQNR